MLKRSLTFLFLTALAFPLVSGQTNSYGKHYLVVVAEHWDGHTGDGENAAADVGLVDYLEWLRLRGYELEVQVVNAYFNVEEVKDIIVDWYEGYEEGTPRYVLLVGDALAHNPDCEYREPGEDWEDYSVQLCTDRTIATYGEFPYSNPDYPLLPAGANWTDYYYCDFDDAQGEPDGYPEFALGRWCPHDDTELENIVRKQFAYERYAGHESGWSMEEVMFAAEPGIYEDHKDAILTSNWWNEGQMESRKLISGEHAELRDFILDALNTAGGAGVVNFRGHGNCYCWYPATDEYGPFDYFVEGSSFSDADIYSYLSNQDCYPLVFSICCLSGCITDRNEDYQSMNEAWVNDEYGAVGAWGATRIVSSTNNGVLDYYLFQGLFDASLGDGYPQRMDVGHAINYAKEKLVQDGTSWSLQDVRSYHWIGDPGLRPWCGETADSSFVWITVFAENSGDVPLEDIPVGIPVTIEVRLGWAQYAEGDSMTGHGPIVDAEVGLYKPDDVVQWGSTEFSSWSGTFEYVGLIVFRDLIFDSEGELHITVTNQQTWKNPSSSQPKMNTPYTMRPIETSIDVAGGSHIAEESADYEKCSISPVSVISANDVVFGYAIPEPSRVSISIYDASGRAVRVLTSDNHIPGLHFITWDGCDSGGASCPEGVYFVVMHSAEFSAESRVVLMK